MATALATQLAHLRAQSTKSFDLKAQKKAHSQSLLFDPHTASTQDFDYIFEVCYEGYEDLCRLDTRFSQFAANIFNEQSKQEDRTQMTEAQNKELDIVLEGFLSLVGGKLLLKPALKAVEWLVRRFRVHENNTLCLVLTFLPYHTSAMFPALLSILPSGLSPILKFLHPYIQSLANPPRHAIVYTASHNRPFFAALSNYTLKTSRLGYHYSTLISFWSSVVTESVAAMLDQARSARRESQQQNQEDVMLLVLPILNEALSFEKTSELKVGCYMVLTVLASKIGLDDGVLTTMMEAVTMGWTETSHAGLICLSALAQQRENTTLPRKVFKATIALENLDDDLVTLRSHYRVDKLVLGLIMGILASLQKSQDHGRLRLLKTLMGSDLMDEASARNAVRSLILTAQSLESKPDPAFDIQSSLWETLLRLSDSKSIGILVQESAEQYELNIGPPESIRQGLDNPYDAAPESMVNEDPMRNADGRQVADDFNTLINRIPTRTAYEISFLSHSDSYVFSSLVHAFSAVSNTEAYVEKFCNLSVLRRSLAMTEPLFLSFFIRLWCSDGPTNVRTSAIQTVSRFLEEIPPTADVQIILPYLIYALADPATKVRRAATHLVLSLSKYFERALGSSKKASLPILGRESIYGQGQESKDLTWLSLDDGRRFIANVLLPSLQECVLDQDHASQLLSESLNGAKHSKGSNHLQKDLRTSLRLAIFSHLCSHIVNTPLHRVKSRLLGILNQVNKVGSTSRTKLLSPILSRLSSQTEDSYRIISQTDDLDTPRYLDHAACIVTSGDRDGIQSLLKIIGSSQSSFPSLRAAALRRLQDLYVTVKPDLQNTIANTLLRQALDDDLVKTGENQGIESIETLRSLPLSTTILQSFIDGLPSFSSSSQDKPPATKRRRTSHGQSTDAVLDLKALSLAVRHTTLVLELIEDAKPERHPELLKSLFQLMNHLQQPQSDNQPATDYLLVLAMDSMLAMLRRVESSVAPQIDHSAIRTDTLIDCVRTTSSPQVRNSALLLVATLATVTPELVLHSVMPIFTFMGANTLHQDNDFSAYVVRQTMESVIPRLILSLNKRKDGYSDGVPELLLSFVAAFEHIPARRRLDLFTLLADRVGPSEYLFALLVMLVENYPGDRKVQQFTVDLCSVYDENVRIKVVIRLLDVILDAQTVKSSLSASLLIVREDRNVKSAIANLLQLLSLVLRDPVLASKIQRKLAKDGEHAALIRTSYLQMLEKMFPIFELSRNDKELNALCMRALDASLGLLTMPELINTLQSLLVRSENNIRRQVLRSFEIRLRDAKGNQKSTQTACVGFLSQLISIIKQTPDASLRCIAIECVDKITERFGKGSVPTVIDSARTISSDVCLGAAETNIRVVSLLCLASMIEAAGDNFISVLPNALPTALDNLALSIQEDTDDPSLHNAVYTFTSALLLYVPWVIIGADLDRLLRVSYESANAGMSEECNQRRVEAMQLVSKQVEAKEVFASLKRTWTNAMTEGPVAVKEYIGILRLAMDRHPKSVIMKYSEQLGDLFMRCLDLRRIQLSPPQEDSYTIEEVEEVEAVINDSAIAMVYKLNDAKFRPLFLRVLEWTAFPESTDKKAKMYRQATWYTFLLRFFGTLKSIVTTYAGFIIEDSLEILNKATPKDESSMFLWKQVVLTLHKTFEHDQDDFYQSPTHFDPISTALISQLANAAQIPLQPELIPAIAELAVAADSTTHHKQMNSAILPYMRSESSAVRLAAVQCESALTERLGEEWLTLLPEMLPFISEALEDDDEGVEREVQRWVVGIEGILGESLNPMLQ